jgi:hypothetical protein
MDGKALSTTFNALAARIGIPSALRPINVGRFTASRPSQKQSAFRIFARASHNDSDEHEPFDRDVRSRCVRTKLPIHIPDKP